MIPSLRHLQRPRPRGAVSLIAILTLTALLVVGLAPARVGAEGGNIYSRTATGDVPPLRAIAGALTGIAAPEGCDIDPANNELWVANFGTNSIGVFSRTAT